jgi:hypothetical protein
MVCTDGKDFVPGELDPLFINGDEAVGITVKGKSQVSTR